MSRAAKYTSEYCTKAEKILSSGKSLAAVCAAMDIGRQTLYDWKDKHVEFKEALDRGIQKAQSYWEEMGCDGISGEIKGFAAAPWIFTMKNRFRDDYSEEKENTAAEKIIDKLIDKLVE